MRGKGVVGRKWPLTDRRMSVRFADFWDSGVFGGEGEENAEDAASAEWRRGEEGERRGEREDREGREEEVNAEGKGAPD